MSYVEFATQLSKHACTLASLIHRHAFPLCSDLLHRTSNQYPLLTHLTQLLGGPTTLAYVLEAILIYISARITLFVVRFFSNTIYRLLRFLLIVGVVALVVCFAAYYYFVEVMGGSGKEPVGLGGNGFWVNQAIAFVGRFASGVYGQIQQQQQPVNFQYNYPPGY
ncbi:hypothetical protein BX661DRAFT_175559 [Kickxella alabastrina]|uniref:uncharacterized protein n=1 Tax=Kickxella alabastrina TaxID=61397 RepID=UPI00221EF6D2|nr:uncharacterized protein BX661DRAFT_175559 [Kickxella alabastrina]KAI7834806.1 hypothetical protein BX661DRAFT_175559 [Kickxella alabastrina]